MKARHGGPESARTSLVITAPDELRQQLAGRKTSRGKASLCLRLRPDRARLHEPLQAASSRCVAVAERVRELDGRSALLDRHLAQLVATAAPRTTSLLGVSTQHAGQLLVTAGQNIERLPNDACLRPPLRRQSDPRLLRTHKQTPAQPRRRPQGQPRTPPDRRLPAPLLRPHPRLRQPSHRRRPDQTRDHPLPQALHRPRALPRPPRTTSTRQPTQHALDIYRNVRIEPQFKGLRYFCLAGTDHPDHETQTQLIRDYIDWRNAHRDDPKLRHLTRRELARKAAALNTANVA